MLYIDHLTKAYGQKKAVDDLSLHIAPGEIYGFIGHNGAGKTTTLKSCAGILRFDAGEIRIDGQDLKTNPLECKRRIAYLPDNPDMYEYMSGIRFLNFIGDIFRVEPTVRRERIHKYAEMLGIQDDLAQPISAFSHGMKQKLALVAAWIHEPRLILMDEPFVGLALRQGRRHLLLHPRAGRGGKALRQGGHHQGGPADRQRLHGRGQGQRLAGGRVPGTGGRPCLSRCCAPGWRPC